MPKKNEKKAAAYPTQQQQQQPVGPPQLPYPMYPPGNNMVNPAVAVASSPYNPYVPVMSGMPPPPPSYDQAMHHPVAPPNYNASYIPVQHIQQQQQVPMNAPGPYYQPYQSYQSHQPHQPQVHVQQVHPQATFVVPKAFDAGARFDSTSQVRIPPPPPGVAPNAAQLAHGSGHNVVLGQRQDRFFTGGSDGGATFW
ncbi:DAZ-associated protein 2-like isoform X1 [Daphnia pulex]|uniref:DAZ-associated protein 2-like isoform X1 n=1 Tax=Daphnia pulex TaxID=6669 RepID=UPI001EDDFAFC|nr:DAZ-associated protein 2-like isoform X1 [Daphnia pulex]